MTVSNEKEMGGEEDEIDVVINPRCFFDVEIGGVSAGRVVFELFANKCPKTVDNFRQLCTGEGGVGKSTGKPLHYKGTVFHRVIKEFMIQGGDFTNFNGTGGESIYGGTFEDEDLALKHDEPFLLSMANRGPNTNGSQFFILTQPASHLNGIHVVFGRVVSGQQIIKQVEGLPVDRKSRPLSDVRVSNCGELILMKKKKEKKPKKEKPVKEKSDVEDEERSSGELSESGSDSKKRKAKASESSTTADVIENQEVQHPLVSLRSIDPDEIPKDPSNHFLSRGKLEEADDKDKTGEKDKDTSKDRRKSRRSTSKSRSRSRSRNRGGRDDRDDRGRGDRNGSDRGARFGGPTRSTDNEGRKIKGRGRICFPRFSSRSRSKTPPHWKAETRKTITMKEFEEREKRKRDKDDELRRRQEEQKKRHEETEAVVRPSSRPERATQPDHRGGGGGGRERDHRPRELENRGVEPRRHFSESLRNRFRESESEDMPSSTRDRESEPKSKTKDEERSAKIVEELTSKLQAAGDGVVYYQHLYKANTTSAMNLNSKDKNDDKVADNNDDDDDDDDEVANILPINKALLGNIGFDLDPPSPKVSKEVHNVSSSFIPAVTTEGDGDEDEGPPGEEDENVLAELRLRRELLKKRLKDWEEDSADEGDEDGNKDKSVDQKKLQSAIEAELKTLNAHRGLSRRTASIGGGGSDVGITGKEKDDDDAVSTSKRVARKDRSKSGSKSKSRSKSRDRHGRGRDRGGREETKRRRNSSKDEGSRHRGDRDRDHHHRHRKDSSRDRKDHRDRDRHRRSRKSKSRSRSRSRSRGHRSRR